MAPQVCFIGNLLSVVPQDRAEAVETQLVNTMQELQELQARQQQLEFENFRLEKLQTMRKDESVQHITSDVSHSPASQNICNASTCFHTTLMAFWRPCCVRYICSQYMCIYYPCRLIFVDNALGTSRQAIQLMGEVLC